MRSFFNSVGLLHRAQPLEHEQSVDEFAAGEAIAQRGPGIDRQKGELGADPARCHPRFPDVVDRLLHGIDRSGRIGLRFRHPEGMVRLLKAFHAMAEIGRLLPPALGIDQDRQVAAQSHCIHGLEEKGAMAPEQILHVVLRGREQDIDPGFIHQAVEPIRIEGDRGCNLLHDIEHDRSSFHRTSATEWRGSRSMLHQCSSILPCPTGPAAHAHRTPIGAAGIRGGDMPPSARPSCGLGVHQFR